jgi:hypothetical protein
MKYIIYLIVGLLAVTLVAPNVKFENTKASETTPIAESEVKADTVKESVKVAPKPVEEAPKERPFAELTLAEKIKANPNNCDLKVQVMYEDGSCHNTTVAPANTVPTTKAITGGGNCEASIRRIFPANEHDRAIRVMLQESSGNPAIHNYNPSTGDDSYGCFQINLAGANKYSRPSPAELVIADNNVSFAYNLWKSTGWCSSGGWLNTSKKVGIC